MHELVDLIKWAFEGFWRFSGFALLLAIVSGGFTRLLTALLIAIKAPSTR